MEKKKTECTIKIPVDVTGLELPGKILKNRNFTISLWSGLTA